MLTAKAQYRLGNAKRYFQEHLCVGDYYSERQQVLGQWFGQGANELGLSGLTRTNEFLRLCQNLHPQTGERLTLRQKTVRTEVDPDGQEHRRANRRVFYDFAFSPPKSVSIAALVGDDTRIVQAHERAVLMALTQLQSLAATRVRKRGQYADRTTGNIVAAVFRHETSRALDPHLHSHSIVFNATFDPVEDRWKALQNHDMLLAHKFVENVYYHELARELRHFGYAIENKLRGDFEIQGVAQGLLEKFSKRHQQIDKETQELLAREPEKAHRNLAQIREHIAHKERARKTEDLDLDRLQALWAGQLTIEETASLRGLRGCSPPASEPEHTLAEGAIAWAEEHLFDRRSVVHEHELWRHALEYARGQNLSLTDLQAITRQRGYVRDERHPGRVTTPELLRREWEIVWRAKEGRDRFHPLGPDHRIRNADLDAEQRQAVEQILQSRDFVTLFRGGAGTGKSYALREVRRDLQESGRTVRVLAPQRQQVMDLEKAGFQGAQTVSAFLVQRNLPRGAVVLVDEAGQIGGKQMLALLELIQENRGRVILSGDTRQHGAVEATDALRAIERHAGLRPVELSTIRRQDPERASSHAERQRIWQYRQAVAEARDGRVAESFRRLDQQGVIQQCTLAEQHEQVTACYLDHVKAKHSTVVVSQSWNEILAVNEQIRLGLKRAKLVDDADTTVTTYQPVDLTPAQKRDPRSYDADTVLVFNRQVRGFHPGDAVRVLALTDTHLLVEGDTRVAGVPFKHLDRLTVCQRKELALATGDRLQLKANGRSEDGRKLANGELVTVEHVQSDGRIELSDGRVLGKAFRQLVRGYAVTSYAAQGKTVDYVLFSDSAVKAATNQHQWYVTVSRGRKGVHIFTTDKTQLRESITRSGDRPLAVELVKPREGKSRWFRLLARRFGVRAARIFERTKHARIARELRERAARHRAQTQLVRPSIKPKQTQGIHV
jgi:conjugative relaxase-like TrwC/TraI family protein